MLNILIVEDNQLAATLVKTFIKKVSPEVQVDVADTGFLTKEKIASVEFEYDIILMDFGLPDCNGLDLTRELRETGTTSMIVGLSGNLDKATPEERTAAGLNGGYHKPFSVDDARELLATYERWRQSKSAMG